MVACVSPVRTRSDEARAPRRRPTASTTMDLPAPVSPGRTVNPGANSTSTDSMTARLGMRRKRSMYAQLPSYHAFDSILVACYPALSAPLPPAHCHADSEALLHTFALSILALQVQEGAAPLGDVNVVDILRQTGTVNLIVLVILVLLSVVSWAIILQKALSYQTVERQTATFLEVFRRSTKFSEVQSVCPSLPASPLVGVFQAGYAELNTQFRASGSGQSNPSEAAARPILKSLAAVDRALLRAAAVEVNKLEKRVPFLATVA